MVPSPCCVHSLLRSSSCLQSHICTSTVRITSPQAISHLAVGVQLPHPNICTMHRYNASYGILWGTQFTSCWRNLASGGGMEKPSHWLAGLPSTNQRYIFLLRVHSFFLGLHFTHMGLGRFYLLLSYEKLQRRCRCLKIPFLLLLFFKRCNRHTKVGHWNNAELDYHEADTWEGVQANCAAFPVISSTWMTSALSKFLNI